MPETTMDQTNEAVNGRCRDPCHFIAAYHLYIACAGWLPVAKGRYETPRVEAFPAYLRQGRIVAPAIGVAR
jgi:hypothetical protein